MKTAKEYLKDYGYENCNPSLIAALIAYASQAIDEAANRATIIRPRESPDYIDRDSILSLKNELK